MSSHPFKVLSDLIGKYDNGKDSFNIKELQDLRDNISLNLFYLSDSFSRALSEYNAAEHNRKIKSASMEIKYREQGYTIAESENRARMDCVEEAKDESEALRKKERVRIILTAVPHILNSLSTRIKNLESK